MLNILNYDPFHETTFATNQQRYVM